MATVYLEYVVIRWKIFLAPMMAETMVDRPGLVSTMSAAPRAASVAPVMASVLQHRCAHVVHKRPQLYTSSHGKSLCGELWQLRIIAVIV